MYYLHMHTHLVQLALQVNKALRRSVGNVAQRALQDQQPLEAGAFFASVGTHDRSHLLLTGVASLLVAVGRDALKVLWGGQQQRQPRQQ